MTTTTEHVHNFERRVDGDGPFLRCECGTERDFPTPNTNRDALNQLASGG